MTSIFRIFFNESSLACRLVSFAAALVSDVSLGPAEMLATLSLIFFRVGCDTS